MFGFFGGKKDKPKLAAKRKKEAAEGAARKKKMDAARAKQKAAGEARRKKAAAKPAAKKTTAKRSATPLAAANRKKGSANSKTNRDYDAAPGGTNRNPRARSQSITKDVTGGVKTKAGTYKTFKKKSEAAKSFRSAFANARKSGYKTFTWNGKKYNTKTK